MLSYGRKDLISLNYSNNSVVLKMLVHCRMFTCMQFLAPHISYKRNMNMTKRKINNNCTNHEMSRTDLLKRSCMTTRGRCSAVSC